MEPLPIDVTSRGVLTRKPWGVEELLLDDVYRIKRILIHAGHRLSFQVHREKVETVYVRKGTLLVVTGMSSSLIIGQGGMVHIPAGISHRFVAFDEDVELLEVSVGSDDDIVRLEDDYGRKDESQ